MTERGVYRGPPLATYCVKSVQKSFFEAFPKLEVVFCGNLSLVFGQETPRGVQDSEGFKDIVAKENKYVKSPKLTVLLRSRHRHLVSEL